ncbi:Rieske (2Fe-2S) protein [Kitasatospora sp. NPDC092948]|uniref:Rieske (2Fe-2S) protein n=1 Tax=Kitasatospora sp. NPDC092948 TaxID=3364088 RepID=UPI0037F255D8
MTENAPESKPPSRRTVLQGATAAGVTAIAGVTATSCAPTTHYTPGATPTAPVSLGKTGDVPVGGGKIYEGQKVVVTQPTQGEFHAFSAICTHQGCLVTKVKSGKIHCPCHNTSFDIKDGSVTHGPAKDPLPELKVTINGDSLTAEPK